MNSENCFKYKTPKWVQKIPKVPFFCQFSWNLYFWKSKYNWYIYYDMLIKSFITNLNSLKISQRVFNQKFLVFTTVFHCWTLSSHNKQICKFITFILTTRFWLMPATESRSFEYHELWNHEMREPPVTTFARVKEVHHVHIFFCNIKPRN